MPCRPWAWVYRVRGICDHHYTAAGARETNSRGGWTFAAAESRVEMDQCKIASSLKTTFRFLARA
jgi:hypothetical protein